METDAWSGAGSGDGALRRRGGWGTFGGAQERGGGGRGGGGGGRRQRHTAEVAAAALPGTWSVSRSEKRGGRAYLVGSGLEKRGALRNDSGENGGCNTQKLDFN